MIDWSLVAKVAGGGFGVTILVLTILAIIVWVVGLMTRERESHTEEKE
jgi:Na+-transporting methylmalonyl-CoA/oxaloacetate decarboxylase gamma subunit